MNRRIPKSHMRAACAWSILALLVILGGCGGGSGKDPDPASTNQHTPPSEDAPQHTQAPNIPPQLANWFSQGIEGKKIVFIGDSTTYHATTLFSELNSFYTKEGEALYGVASVKNFGANGATLWAFLADNIATGITASILEDADLYILSYGINDIRLGNTTEDQLTQMLREAVERMRTALPNADFVLRIPNSLLSTDVNGFGYVQPNEYAQLYTDILRNAYLHLEGSWDNVIIFDSQSEVFGTIASPASDYMSDQLHPSSAGYRLLAEKIVGSIGIFSLFDETLSELAIQQNSTEPFLVYPRVVEDPRFFELIATGRWVTSTSAGDMNGYIDLSWPGERANEITCSDIVQMAVNHVFALPDTCQVTQIGNRTRIYNLGPDLPPFTMTGGTINVWRRL